VSPNEKFLVRCTPWTMRSLDDASLGPCVPWTMRSLDHVFLGPCVPWTMRSLDDAFLDHVFLGACVPWMAYQQHIWPKLNMINFKLTKHVVKMKGSTEEASSK
jgi:hypothetical protein